jgi:hypothetical protein
MPTIHWDDDYYDEEDYLIDGVGFADPGGDSALRAETPDNPRNLPCPTCGFPNRLTPIDRARGYQCDACANAMERGMDIVYYEGDSIESDHLEAE